MFRKITSAAVSVTIAASAFALPINDIDPGDSYYLSLLFENELVTVTRVDRSSHRVKIRRKNGYTEWVSPSRLLSYGSSFEEDATTAVVGVALVACLLMPEECSKATSSSSSSSSSTSRYKSSSSRKRVTVQNQCKEDVKVSVLREVNSVWQNKHDWVWTIPAYKTYDLTIHNNSQYLMSDHSTIYINAASKSFVWDGDGNYTYGDVKKKFRKASVIDDGNRYRIRMTCS